MAGHQEIEALGIRARSVHSAVLAEIAKCLEDPLNAAINRAPQDSLEEKRSLATWVNGFLRGLGLAIRSPRTGRPGILTAAPGRDEYRESRFRIMHRDRGRIVYAASTGWVERLDLIEDDRSSDPERRRG